MLVLSRKAGQDIYIGDNIRITVNKISGNRVTIGIAAPNDVRIIRGELEPIVKSFEDEKAKQTGKEELPLNPTHAAIDGDAPLSSLMRQIN